MLRFFELPLAIDGGTIAAIVGMVISFVVWAAQQASAKGKQEDQKKRQAQAAARQRALQQQQQQRNQARQRAGQQGQRVAPRASQEDEVDAFLRSAAQQQQSQRPPAQRSSGQRPPATLPSSSRPPQTSRPPSPPQRQAASAQRKSAQPRPQSSRPGSPAPPQLYDGLETSDFAASAASMGHLDGHEHDLERHVHDVFDHDLNKLDDQIAARDLDTFGDTSLLDADLHPRDAAAAKSAAAKSGEGIEDDIVEMFRNPANIRNAIVMQEILRRPSF